MPRSGEAARQRLRQAAIELFEERGFDQTTAAEIAARAGVNERTFFRHFPDKREVLFDGEAPLRDTLTQSIAEAAESLPLLDILLLAFQKAGQRLSVNREFAETRFAVISATPALRERELAKHASLIAAVTQALRQREVPDRLAELAARSGWAAFDHAVRAWTVDPAESLDAHLSRAFDDLRALDAARLPR